MQISGFERKSRGRRDGSAAKSTYSNFRDLTCTHTGHPHSLGGSQRLVPLAPGESNTPGWCNTCACVHIPTQTHTCKRKQQKRNLLKKKQCINSVYLLLNRIAHPPARFCAPLHLRTSKQTAVGCQGFWSQLWWDIPTSGGQRQEERKPETGKAFTSTEAKPTNNPQQHQTTHGVRGKEKWGPAEAWPGGRESQEGLYTVKKRCWEMSERVWWVTPTVALHTVEQEGCCKFEAILVHHDSRPPRATYQDPV